MKRYDKNDILNLALAEMNRRHYDYFGEILGFVILLAIVAAFVGWHVQRADQTVASYAAVQNDH